MKKLFSILITIIIIMSSVPSVGKGAESQTYKIYLPYVVRANRATVDISNDIFAHSLMAACAVVKKRDAFVWDDVYNCPDTPDIFVPNGLVSIARSYEPGMTEYAWGTINRWYIEYPLPPRVAPDSVLGLQICLSTQYWSPDDVLVQAGTWMTGTVDRIATDPNPDKMAFADEFFANVWQEHGQTLYTVPPLPDYTIYQPCTDTFIPVTPDQDGVLRLVLRTADETQGPDRGRYGFGTYTFDHGVYSASPVYLVYRP